MEQETPITTQVVEGTPSDNGANQETGQVTQVPLQSQETTTVTEVDNGSNKPQEPAPQRGPASGYYKEREKDRRLANEISELKRLVSEMRTPKSNDPATDIPDFDPAHFSPEHKRILAARENALKSEIASLKQEVKGYWDKQAEAENWRESQGVLEKLFPKTGPDSKGTVHERILEDQDRAMRIKDILDDYGLNTLAKKDPDEAARFILGKLGEGPKQTNPTVLKKALMGGSGSGSGGNASLNATENDLRSAVKKLGDQLTNNPGLRSDPKFMEQRLKTMSDLERLVTKK